MTAKLTLAPSAGVLLRLDADLLHVSSASEASAPAQPANAGGPAPRPPSGSNPAAGGDVESKTRPRRPPPIWPTFVSPDAVHEGDDLLKTAPEFNSFTELARADATAFASGGDGRLFARVRASGAVDLNHIKQALDRLPRDSQLMVAVDLNDDH